MTTDSAGFMFLDPTTGRRASIATYVTREQAEEARTRSLARNASGVRPDITREFIERLIIEPEQECPLVSAPTLDDQELIAEARKVVAPYRRDLDAGKWVTGIGMILMIEKLTTALSAAAVRYRAEGRREGIVEAHHVVADLHEAFYTSEWGSVVRVGTACYHIRALLDENNETQED